MYGVVLFVDFFSIIIMIFMVGRVIDYFDGVL